MAVKSIAVVAEITPEIEYYYDLHPTEEDLMGENRRQDKLNEYLVLLLEWFYRLEGWYIARNLNLYVTRDEMETPLAPDIAVIKVAVPAEEEIESWYIDPPDSPAPVVVFEIASKKTWKKDINDKPPRYAAMGVKECFYYDPRRRVPRGGVRLRGWSCSHEQAYELAVDDRGWLWSEELQSWLVPEGRFLRLYDANLQQRLTGEEAERAAKEKAWSKLRELGIDPESL